MIKYGEIDSDGVWFEPQHGQLEKIPDNGTALGVEQLIMELNGWRGKASNTVKPVLSNINNATIKEIYTTQVKNWLNANVEGWEKLFKIN